MNSLAVHAEPLMERQVFKQWAIAIPPGFQTTFVEDEGYWHAWDLDRSVSLTSTVLTDRRGRAVPARRILKQVPPLPGARIDMPPGLRGWAVIMDAEQPARASRAISGMIVSDGRVLLGTVTADDVIWATAVWRSIRRV